MSHHRLTNYSREKTAASQAEVLLLPRCCCLIGAFTVFHVAHHALRRLIVVPVDSSIVFMRVPKFHVNGRPSPTLGCHRCHLCTAMRIHTRPGQALLDKTASLECSAIPKIILSPNALWL